MELTLITVVAVHLLAVNLAGAGPLVVVWLDWLGGRRQQPPWQAIARRLAWWSILAAAVGMAIGLAALAELLVLAAAIARLLSVDDSRFGARHPVVVRRGGGVVLLCVHACLRAAVAAT